MKEDKAVRMLYRFLVCTDDPACAALLSGVVGEIGQISPMPRMAADLAERLEQWRPQLVFLDFLADEDEGQLRVAADLAQRLAALAPAVPRVAVCRLAGHQGAMAALRAGVRDIVDPEDPAALLAVVRRLAGQGSGGASEAIVSPRGSVLLLGVRAGMGATTLAAHLTSYLQGRLAQNGGGRHWWRRAPGSPPADGSPLPLRQRAVLLDLGLPVGDGLLYLGLGSSFDFMEAARNLSRLDETLLASAVAHADSGASVLPWPRDLAAMGQVPLADAISLLERLREYFGAMVVDTGGFFDADFIGGLLSHVDHVWLMADQSMGALVSLAERIESLEALGVERGRLELVLNRYDERYGMEAGQVAARFGLALRAVVPERPLPLRKAMSRGELLALDSWSEPYVRAVRRLGDAVLAAHGAAARQGSER